MGAVGLGTSHRGPALCRFSFSNPKDTGFITGELGGVIWGGTLQVVTSCQLDPALCPLVSFGDSSHSQCRVI